MTPCLALPIHPISSSHTKHLVVSSLNVTLVFMGLVTDMHSSTCQLKLFQLPCRVVLLILHGLPT